MVSALVAALPLVSMASAAIIEHWWNVSYAMANPDGAFERRVIGVNGTWPPPVLESSQGDVHLIHAYNGLGDDHIPTALHAHGMFFNGTNFYDGATGVTQCGIPNGHTLDYHIDTSLNHGTYWAHGHYNGQYVDGFRTPNIVHPKVQRTDNVTWDDEYTIIVSDWYHKEHQDMLDNEFLTWKNPTGAEPVPEAALIYVVHNGSYVGNIAAGEGTSGAHLNNAAIKFEAGKTYRLRFINMAALSMFMIGIDGHEWSVIETDGVDVTPYKLDILTISVAQRFSMLVKANEDTSKNFAMTIMQSEDMYDQIPEELVLNNTLQVVYNDGNEAGEMQTFDDYGETIDDTWFKPIDKQASAPADVQYEIHAFFDTFDDGTNRASFTLEGGPQNITYRSPKVPTIFSAMSMGEDAMNPKVYGEMTNTITYKHMQNIELKVFNWDAGFHPFHLHGHTFQVIAKVFNISSDSPEENPPVNEDAQQENPARRDTITIPPQGYVILRFRADNPGAWFFHCHIDWHLSSGLAMVFVEAPEVMQTNLTIPQQMIDHCNFFDTPTTGNVVGLNSTSDFKGQTWGPFPVVMGWTPKAIGAMAGCIITFLVGLATIIWYGTGELDEEDLEEEVRRNVEAKQHKTPLWKKVAGRK